MVYRKLGRTGLSVSEIGMGLEHLLDKDERTVVDTIRAAVRGGVNYLDCHVGHDYKEEIVEYDGYIKLGRALEGLREKLFISYVTYYDNRTDDYVKPRFEYFLKALDTDYADVYIIQFCDKIADYELVTKENGALDFAKKLKAEGKIRFIGLSTHSSAIALKAIESGEFDVLMYPVNPAFDVLTDEEQYKTDDLGTLWDAAHDFSAGEKTGIHPRKNVYTECERNNIGLVAMKPFAGGFIFGVEENAGFTPVNLISYALTQTGVSTVVPGCTKPQEINEILEYCNSSEFQRDYSEAVAKSRWCVTGNCIYCNHCLPCVVNISIGQVNRLIDFIDYNKDDVQKTRERYNALSAKASACTECGICEERCPFDVKVIDRLKYAIELFEE